MSTTGSDEQFQLCECLFIFFDSLMFTGAIFIPCMLPYILAAPVSGKYLARVGRYVCFHTVSAQLIFFFFFFFFFFL